LLREDNADLRLTPKGRELGLVDDMRWRAFETKREAIEREAQRLRDTWVVPGAVPEADARRVLGQPLAREYRLVDLLRRPEVSYATLMTLPGAGTPVADPLVAEQLEVQAKYAGYIDRQRDEIERQRRFHELRLPAQLDYAQVTGLSNEVRQKLAQQRPETVGQAARIPGVTPAAISLLLIHLKKSSGSERLTA
jgi:tRNA uridine 5-carboxymethylaminomethyl modification enzyme